MQQCEKFQMSCLNPEILSFQSTPLKILFASETGNSAKVAQMIHIEALKRGFLSSIHSLNQNLIKFNLSLPWNCISQSQVKQDSDDSLSHICIIVCSSTGNGDPPKNGEKFIKYLRRNRKNKSLLRHVRFAIMGLGDSNYTKYQGIPIYVQEKMKEMGAVQIIKRGQVDDAYSQPQEVVVPWISSIWEILRQQSHIQRQIMSESFIPQKSTIQISTLSPYKGDFKQPKLSYTTPPTKSPNTSKALPQRYDYKNTARLRVKKVELITGKDAIKQVKLITLDTDKLPIPFDVQIGGSISIFPEHKEELVLKFLYYFQIAGSNQKLINNPRLVFELQKKYDFTSQIVPLSFLNVIKDFLPEQTEIIQLYTLIQNYNKRVKREKLNTIQALDMILGCDQKLKIYSEEDFSLLMHKLPQIKPRLYSTVQNTDRPTEISFALSIHSFQVSRKKQNISKIGFCSQFIQNLTENNYISIFPMTNTSIFRDIHVNSFKFGDFIPSMLFFAHGTSITPIVSYLRSLINYIQQNEQFIKQNEQKQQRKIGGPISLFYGCRSCDQGHCDFLFKNQIEEYFSFLKRVYHKDCTLKVAESYEKVIEAQKGNGDQCEIGEWHGIQVNSQYVYDLIASNNEIVEQLVLKDNGIICVCGDGMSMSRVVEDRIDFVIKKKKKQEKVQFDPTFNSIQDLIAQNRYFKQTWIAN